MYKDDTTFYFSNHRNKKIEKDNLQFIETKYNRQGASLEIKLMFDF